MPGDVGTTECRLVVVEEGSARWVRLEGRAEWQFPLQQLLQSQSWARSTPVPWLSQSHDRGSQEVVDLLRT